MFRSGYVDKQNLLQAVELYKAGDKEGAQKLLSQIVNLEPENIDAWYGLYLCATSNVERINLLEKCLAINPEHQKARKALDILQGKKKSGEILYPISDPIKPSQIENDGIEMDEEIESPALKKSGPSANWFFRPVIILMMLLMIWQFIRIDQLEKSLQTIAYELNTVGALARNADNYAHSHSYSDAKLKIDLIFPSSVGTPMDPHNLRKDFVDVVRQVGLPVIRFHDLRHTAASLMLNHSVPVLVVSRMLGHANPSITLNTYAHLYHESQGQAARLMDELVSPLRVEIPAPAPDSLTGREELGQDLHQRREPERW